MKLKGIVQIQRIDALTHEVLETIEQENTITVRAYQSPTEYPQSAVTLGPNIILGLEDAPSHADFPRILSYVTGTTPVGATSPQLLYSNDLSLYYSQWIQRFTPPSSGTRTIYLIGLTNQTGPAFGGGFTVNAYVHLNTPCLQSSTELLDVTYRIQWVPDAASTVGQSLHPTDVYAHAYGLTFPSVLSTFPTYLYTNALPIAYAPSEGKYRNIYIQTQGDQHSMRSIVTGLSGVTTTTYNSPVDGSPSPAPSSSPSTSIFSVSCTTDAIVGRLIAAEAYGLSSERVTSWKNITAPTGSAIQPIHSHAASTFTGTPTPFLDAVPATGTGKIVGGGTWTNPDLPEMYMVKVTNPGAVGAATYQFWKRNITGFIGPSYAPISAPYFPLATSIDLTSATPFADVIESHGLYTPPVTSTYSAGKHRIRIARLSKKHVVTADDTGITIFDASNTGITTLNALTSPALPVTKVKQVSCDEAAGVIWVACANTGLWKVTNLGTTVLHITNVTNGVPSDNCHAVDVGAAGKVWGVFTGGLAASADGGTTWTTYNEGTLPAFTFAGVSDSNWNSVNYMKVDRSDVNDHLLLVRDPDTTVSQTTGFVWWSPTAPTAVGVTMSTYDNTLRAHSQGFDVSPSGSFWVMGQTSYSGAPVRKLTFGSTSITNIGSYATPYCPTFWFTEDTTGNPLVAVPTTYGSPAQVALYDIAGTQVATFSVQTPTGMTGYFNIFSWPASRSYLVHLGDGVLYTHGYSGTTGYARSGHAIGAVVDSTNTFVGPVNHITWSKYGWNGSAWELNHTGSKTTHSTNEELLHGVTIRFEDGASGTSFVQDDYYTFGVANGILKDNSIAYTSTTSVRMYPTHTSTDFDGVVRPYPSVGTVTWKQVSDGITINPDQSLTSSNVNRPYAWYAISDTRVFGDFTITGTVTNTSASTISIGITPQKGACVLENPYWTESYYNPYGQSEFDFSFSSTTLSWRGWSSNSNMTTPVNGTWSISRVGSTLTLIVNGVTRATATSTQHSFVVRVLSGTPSTGTATVAPITVTSSGTGYYTSVGSIANSTGVYDPRFLFVEPDPKHLQLALDGTPVTIKLSNTTTAPAPGEAVLIPAHGDILFNAADNGKVVTGSFFYSTR